MLSPADAGYVGLYPCAFVGLVLLHRARGGDRRRLGVDGAVGALALTALGSTLLYGPLADALAAPTGIVTNLAYPLGDLLLYGPLADALAAPTGIVTNLAYPLGDLLLLGLLGGGVAMTGWRLRGAYAWIAAGRAVFAVSDALYVYTNQPAPTATAGSSTRAGRSRRS